MDTLQIQDEFDPYYAGIETHEKADQTTPRLKMRDRDAQAVASERERLAAIRRRVDALLRRHRSHSPGGAAV